jgi:hypothetical protein
VFAIRCRSCDRTPEYHGRDQALRPTIARAIADIKGSREKVAAATGGNIVFLLAGGRRMIVERDA